MALCIGVDPSVTSTGIVILDENANVLLAEAIKPKGLKGLERVIWLRNTITGLIDDKQAEHPTDPSVAIEGYAYSNAFSLATLVELGTALRLAFIDKGYRYVEPDPGQVKRFAGILKRARKKDKPVEEVRKLWGFEHKSHDVIDAYVMARIAHGFVRPELYRGLDYQQDVLMKCRRGITLCN